MYDWKDEKKQMGNWIQKGQRVGKLTHIFETESFLEEYIILYLENWSGLSFIYLVML